MLFRSYLDIYYEKKRRYEFLKLYLIPENSSEARKQNKLKRHDVIIAKRVANELIKYNEY